MKSILFFFVCLSSSAFAQDSTDYYYQIPAYPESYSAGTVAARMVDALGFRYYWGTAGLRAEDMDYQPSADARTTGETIDHIYGLTFILANATKQLPNDFAQLPEDLNFEEKRAKTLQYIREASEQLNRSTAAGIESYKIIFTRSDGITEYPFWNLLNGPLADAIWHVGQVVSFRRASGNPFNSNASLMKGKLKD